MPCPTPTVDLDRHREEASAAQDDVGRAADEVRALAARRDAARAQAQAAAAALDSLEQARQGSGKR